MQQSKGLVNERCYKIPLTIVYLEARLCICLALFLSSGKMSEVIKSRNSWTHVGASIDCGNGKIASRVETSSIVTPKLLGVSPEVIFAN